MDHDPSDLSEYNETIDPAPGIAVDTADYEQLSEQLQLKRAVQNKDGIRLLRRCGMTIRL